MQTQTQIGRSNRRRRARFATYPVHYGLYKYCYSRAASIARQQRGRRVFSTADNRGERVDGGPAVSALSVQRTFRVALHEIRFGKLYPVHDSKLSLPDPVRSAFRAPQRV